MSKKVYNSNRAIVNDIIVPSLTGKKPEKTLRRFKIPSLFKMRPAESGSISSVSGKLSPLSTEGKVSEKTNPSDVKASSRKVKKDNIAQQLVIHEQLSKLTSRQMINLLRNTYEQGISLAISGDLEISNLVIEGKWLFSDRRKITADTLNINLSTLLNLKTINMDSVEVKEFHMSSVEGVEHITGTKHASLLSRMTECDTALEFADSFSLEYCNDLKTIPHRIQASRINIINCPNLRSEHPVFLDSSATYVSNTPHFVYVSNE